MYAFIVRRLLTGLLIIWGVYTLTFLAVNLAPGDPFTAKENAKISEADLDRLRAKWGYDLPVIERYFLHLRKMFWADPDVLDYEGEGLGFEVCGTDDGARIRAWVQEPPDEIVLAPTPDSVLDWGSEEVRLRRLPDGTYERRPLKEGQYRFGLRRLSVAEADAKLVSQGVTITFRAGLVTAVRTLETQPTSIRLERVGEETAPILLSADSEGRFPAVPIAAGRYTHDILIPEAPLDQGGLTFDLGTSLSHSKPVVEYLLPKLWATLMLGVAAILLSFTIGIFLGVTSAIVKDSPVDHTITVGALFIYSMPGFWLALMLQLLFAVELGWLPIDGMHSVGESGFWDLLEHMAMPAFVLGVASAASTARFQRSAILEVMSQDYIRTARAKGLAERVVIWKHVMRNSLLPVITLFGLSLPFLVSGAVITEQIFSWPGIGRAAIGAIVGRDVFVITAITLMATTMVVLGNLLADILYAIVDPRVRLQ